MDMVTCGESLAGYIQGSAARPSFFPGRARCGSERRFMWVEEGAVGQKP